MEKRNYFGDFVCWEYGRNTEHRWDQRGSVMGEFAVKTDDSDFPEPEFVWAVYGGGSYDGSAVVVFRRDGAWYQVEGSHCSCYGLEDQWSPGHFEAQLHLEAVAGGSKKRFVNVESGYYDWNGSTNKDFDEWLKWAVNQA